MQVGSLVKINDRLLTDKIFIVQYVGHKATLLYNSTDGTEEWYNNFIWAKWMEVICK